MTYTDPRHLGEAQEIWRRNGVSMIHADAIKLHLSNLPRGHDEDGYDGQDCMGVMVFHGQRVAREDGTIIVHWAGGMMFRDVVCQNCGATWSIETAYREMLRETARGSVAAAVKEDDAW